MIALLALGPGARADMDLFGAYYNNVARAAAANDAADGRASWSAASGSKANAVDDSGRTGLQIAATNGNLQIAAILIKAGANLEPEGQARQHRAASRDRPQPDRDGRSC